AQKHGDNFKDAPQSSCSGPSFSNLVADEVLQQDQPIGIHLQAFAADFFFLIDARTEQEVKSFLRTPIQTANRRFLSLECRNVES
ncbi:hypothetical protein AVEN_87202-1, partial [Araneus ventricosus]